MLHRRHARAQREDLTSPGQRHHETAAIAHRLADHGHQPRGRSARLAPLPLPLPLRYRPSSPTGGAARAAHERAGVCYQRCAGRASGGQERKESCNHVVALIRLQLLCFSCALHTVALQQFDACLCTVAKYTQYPPSLTLSACVVDRPYQRDGCLEAAPITSEVLHIRPCVWSPLLSA